ncbi:hypothetical protein VZT92_012509 [Zoarces viviparus]|uniref:Sacsin/Nov domain-containing protein n=1 Tax=Zoarces viviparus TaxID=48416 RepID=A0AAW1F0X4_ZOAVI
MYSDSLTASEPERRSSKTKKKPGTSFGATAPPFIDYLQDILRQYPDGGQILKELIQNADDASVAFS